MSVWLTNFKIWGVVLLSAMACQKLNPRQIVAPEYPDFNLLFNEQVQKLATSQLNKKIVLDDAVEERTFTMDTSLWKKELSFLKEINPNRPEFIGSFQKEESPEHIFLKLKAGETGAIEEIYLKKIGSTYTILDATFHENKDLYTYHKKIEVSFKDGLISSYEINGYQKVLMKDTLRFRIIGNIR